MDVCLNTDRMLAYFDTSGHDDQTLREVYGKQPATEFLEWGLCQGIFARDSGGAVIRGPRWGDPRQFCESEAEFQELFSATPAVYGFETAGPRPANAVARQVRLNQGVGREAIYAELQTEELQRVTPFRLAATEAKTKEAHLGAPDLGARLRLGDPETQREAARFSGNPAVRFEYTVISNIYSGGLPPDEGAGVVLEKVAQILGRKAAGNRLEALLKRSA
jgi:ethanolamine ammonia-lyase small subunit